MNAHATPDAHAVRIAIATLMSDVESDMTGDTDPGSTFDVMTRCVADTYVSRDARVFCYDSVAGNSTYTVAGTWSDDRQNWRAVAYYNGEHVGTAYGHSVRAAFGRAYAQLADGHGIDDMILRIAAQG